MKNKFKLFLEQNNATNVKVWKDGYISALLNGNRYYCLWLPDGTQFFSEKDKVVGLHVYSTGHIKAQLNGNDYYCLRLPNGKKIGDFDDIEFDEDENCFLCFLQGTVIKIYL